jgi:translation initiation factor 3 subunit H
MLSCHTPFASVCLPTLSFSFAKDLWPQASDTSEQYQLTKMRCLRDINVDSNTVGWYQSAPYKDYQTLNLLDTFISYEESVKKCVCIVCDSKDCHRGSLALKALRLNKKFMDLYKVDTNV